MNEPDVWQLFRERAEVSTKLYVAEEIYGTEQRRTHRRPRINKKWLKRFGTRRVLIDVHHRPINSTADLDTKDRMLLVRTEARPRVSQIRVMHSPPMPVDSKPTDKVEVKETIYDFPKVAFMQHISREFYEDMQTKPSLAKYISDQFWREAEKHVRQGTKIRDANRIPTNSK